MSETRNEGSYQQDDVQPAAAEIFDDLDVEIELETAETSFSFTEPRPL